MFIFQTPTQVEVKKEIILEAELTKLLNSLGNKAFEKKNEPEFVSQITKMLSEIRTCAHLKRK